jgi:TonB-dependent receptor
MLLATPSYAAEEDKNEQVKNDEIEVIQVTGIRGSLIEAMNTKRFSSSVVDSISAVDIGKLPDATIADSLQRITGIQITRSGGEGAKVNIRGNGNVATTLNGEQMITAGSITAVTADFADIPSTMVSGLDVYKSSQAKNIISGLSGTIDLRTNRPFMLEDGWTALGKAEVTHGSLGKEVDPTVSGFIGFNNDSKFGFTLNVSKSDSHLADYTNGSQGGEPGSYGGWSFMAKEASNFVEDNIDANGDGDFNDVYYAFQGHQAGNRFIDRDRTGINGSAQYQIAENWLLTGDIFYTKLDEYQFTNALTASQAWTGVTGWFTPEQMNEYENITHVNGEAVIGGGSFYTVQSADYQARMVKAQSTTRVVEKEALNTNIELSYDTGDALTLNLRWVHGEASGDETNSVVDAFLTDGSQIGDTYHGPGKEFISHVNPWGYQGQPALLPDGTESDAHTQIPVNINYMNGTQNWSFDDVTLLDGSTEVFGSNLNRYSNKSSNLYGTYTNAEFDAIRLDGAYELEFDSVWLEMVSSVDFGVRYGKREVKKQGWYGGVARTNQHGDAFLARWKDTATDAPVTAESYIAPISFTELNEKGMIKSVSDFHGTTGLGEMYFIDPKTMKNPIAWHEEIYGTNVLVEDAANIYSVEEKVSSAYVQVNLDGDLAGFSYTGNIGVRYIETEFDIMQSDSLVGNVAEFNGQEFLIGPGILQPVGVQSNTINKYNDLLPAVNLAIDLTSEQVLRFSYTETMSTHNTDDLGGGLSVNRVKTCNLTTSSGETVFCATGGSQSGNPKLEPFRNNNAEVSYEWYFSEAGMFNVGAFIVKGNTETRSVLVPRNDVTDSDGVVRGYDIDTNTNTGVVPIQTSQNFAVSGDWSDPGFEVGYQQGLDFLPGNWSGLGITANYTYSPSDSTQTDYYGKSLPGSGNSKHQSNLALWYEKDGLQARIAHNYRSEMFQALKQDGLYQFAYYTEATNYIDASISYDINDSVTLSLQGTNLTEEVQSNYHQWSSHVDGRVYAERRITAGIQVKL